MWSWAEVKERFSAIAPKLKAGRWPALFTTMAAGAQYSEGHLHEFEWAVPLAAVAAHLFVLLSAHRAEEAVAALSDDSSNHDLEKAFAEALRQALRAAGHRIATMHPVLAADLQEWFQLWDRRLERGLVTPEDAGLLFRSSNPPDPTKGYLPLWPGFEQDLLRWANEEIEFDSECKLDVTELPGALRAELETLPEATYSALQRLVRKEEMQRAWIAWAQRFQQEQLRLLTELLEEMQGLRKRDIAQIIKEVRRLRLDLKKVRTAQSYCQQRSDPSEYFQQLSAQTHYIDIRGLQVAGGKVRRLEITKIYTPLTTWIGASNFESGEHDRGFLAVPLQAVLDRPRLVLVGAPGGGKSTFLRRVAYAASETLLKKNANPAVEIFRNGACPFPILISAVSLEKYISEAVPPPGSIADKSSPAWVVRYLAAKSEADNWNLSADYFRQHLREGCLLLIDGLDEVPRRSRRQFARFLENLGAAYPKSRMVATSRPAAYGGETALPGFEDFEIQDFDAAAVGTYVSNWCRLLCESEREAQYHGTSLLGEIRAKPEIEKLAVNPVMLTALASLHWNGKRLPAQRSELYDSILNWLAEAREEHSKRPARVLLLRMQRIATAMHTDERGKQVEYTQHEAAETIQGEFDGKTQVERLSAAIDFLHEEETYSGILIGDADRVKFWHQTFQEALAGLALAGDDDAREQHLFDAGKLLQPEWRETVLLMAGQLCKQGPKRTDAFLRRILAILKPTTPLIERAPVVALVSAILRDLESWNFEFRHPAYKENLDLCLSIFDSEGAGEIPFETRLEVAEVLGKSSDPRLRRNNWMPIGQGEFLMGAPKQPVPIEAFDIGRYPITVQEYKIFVDSGGYQNPCWWRFGGFQIADCPQGWESQWEHPNHPITGVSWYEAIAYCSWARQRLPTDEEWEAAACGAKARTYPWGDERPDASRANYRGTGPLHPTPVGLYPLGGTPEGIQDMAGNVLEWTSGCGGTSQGLRGGCWREDASYLRSAFRIVNDRAMRDSSIGFRCAR